jgi:hypothetical protein
VARAVDRYQVWWKSLASALPITPLCEVNFHMNSVAYTSFPADVNALLAWVEDLLPPLGKPCSTYFLYSMYLANIELN